MYRVIICEDEDIIRKGLIYSFPFLKTHCQVVADFDNGQDCYNYCTKHQVDIIITDIKMPLMNGLELIERVKKLYMCEFIILSGYSDFEFARKAIKFDVNEYLLKPVNYDLLTESLEKAIAKIKKRNKLFSLEKLFDARNKVSINKAYNDDFLEAIIDYIKLNYMHKIKLNDLASSLNYSVSTIKNKLKNYNLHFNTLLNKYRIFVAINLITASNKNIYDIATEVGFCDYKYFCTKFKNYTGYSVSEFIQKDN